MKKLFGLMVLVGLGLSALGQSIQFAWDPVVVNGRPGSYRLYAGTNSLATSTTSAAVKLDAGTVTYASVDRLAAGTWFFVVTSYGYSTNVVSGTNAVTVVESAPSNQLVLSVPSAPGQLATVYVQWQGSQLSTNWQDVGFFRIRVGQ